MQAAAYMHDPRATNGLVTAGHVIAAVCVAVIVAVAVTLVIALNTSSGSSGMQPAGEMTEQQRKDAAGQIWFCLQQAGNDAAAAAKC